MMEDLRTRIDNMISDDGIEATRREFGDIAVDSILGPDQDDDIRTVYPGGVAVGSEAQVIEFNRKEE